ncbi:hypothetical protein [Rhizobium paknamense]|uniref:Nucleotidyltransferase domain-containing protein n=1 Tax=Rhizobium paknamense TaxID=1206817 RepID=A0ABU0ILW2_9HYPH|nr:hypothetical protein [Rhizobium paknamense]MDQ0458360.1 hypothetical protein [Rhizobium paknamense]
MSEPYANPLIDSAEICRAGAELRAILQRGHVEATHLAVIGSAALGTQIRRDIDLAIGTTQAKQEVLAQLSQFRGERPATPNSARLLFCLTVDGRHIELNVMTLAYIALLHANLSDAAAQLSAQDRTGFVQRKTQFRDERREREMDEYKTTLYQRFCPDFLWTTDDQIVRGLAESFARRGDPLPLWLSESRMHRGNQSSRGEEHAACDLADVASAASPKTSARASSLAPAELSFRGRRYGWPRGLKALGWVTQYNDWHCRSADNRAGGHRFHKSGAGDRTR